ncbi:MAG: hypothetical protein AB8B56_11575 [Crocinitomicaceae bacterium]
MSNSVTMYLQKITCQNTSEIGNDEVFIYYTADGGRPTRFPKDGYHSMDSNNDSVWVTNLPMTFKETLVVELCDSDTIGNDSLGTHTYVTADASKNEQEPYSNSNGAKYTVYTGPNKI